MIDFIRFVLLGELGQLGAGDGSETIFRLFGDPEIYSPERKSYPSIVLYGDLEFRLRNDHLTYVSISFYRNNPSISASVKLINFLDEAERHVDSVIALLRRNNIKFHQDTRVNISDRQLTLLTENNVYLGFNDGILVKVAVEYL